MGGWLPLYLPPVCCPVCQGASYSAHLILRWLCLTCLLQILGTRLPGRGARNTPLATALVNNGTYRESNVPFVLTSTAGLLPES